MPTIRSLRSVACVWLACLVLACLVFVPLAGAQEQAWMDTSLSAARRADLLVAAMTLEQKIQQLHGQRGPIPEVPSCGNTRRHVPGIPELKIPTFRITNGPVGLGEGDCQPYDKATAVPVAVALAASFDPDLAYEFGELLGMEARSLGVHELEGPGMNLARVGQNGRNFEYLGEDPFLAGTIAVKEIQGIQSQGVIAMAKHYVLNNQETDRNRVSVVVDDRPYHELYLLPFEMSVKEGDVGSVMCSYNRIAGVYACDDQHALTDILRTQWGFQGYVQSDFGATHSTAESLNAGEDLEMENARFYTPEAINQAISDGTLTVATIDRALKRRYTQAFQAGVFDRPVEKTAIDAKAHGAIARSMGEQTSVLLKNDGILPLDTAKVRNIALIGQARYVNDAAVGGGGSSLVSPLYTIAPLQGLQNTLAALDSQAAVNLTVVADDLSDMDEAVNAARTADAVIVMAGVYTREGADLPNLSLPNKQDDLIAAVAAANPRTVVVLKDLDPVLMPWLGEVPAVMEVWNPGEEDGNVVARLLFGAVNPSGKLPISYPRSLADTPTSKPENYPGTPSSDGFPKVLYSEGLRIGYRWYNAQKIEPLFPFGFGLSYTTFRISGLTVNSSTTDGTRPIELRFTVENAGDREGAEVAQVYLEMPPEAAEPPKRLVGFSKVSLKPGETREVRVSIDPAASNHPLGIWDSAAQNWTTPKGEYRIFLGNSSANVAASVSVTVQ